VGSNKRYAAHYDALMGRRLLEQDMRGGAQPESLTDVEKALDRYALTRPPRPVPAQAWVRYGGHAHLIEVELVAWTERVAAIRWPGPDGGPEHRAWVWASAVEVRDRSRR
jgi:hypothetical protein